MKRQCSLLEFAQTAAQRRKEESDTDSDSESDIEVDEESEEDEVSTISRSTTGLGREVANHFHQNNNCPAIGSVQYYGDTILYRIIGYLTSICVHATVLDVGLQYPT